MKKIRQASKKLIYFQLKKQDRFLFTFSGKNCKKKMSELLSSNDFLSPKAIEEKHQEVDGVKEAIERSGKQAQINQRWL